MADRPKEKGGRVVFIGNIPYGVSEEQICDTFAQCGKVINFRLVYDKETGRPKGFGFLEYTNVDDAASAVRNLDGHEIMGRTLRVDYSNDNGGGGKTGQNESGSGRAPPPAHFGMDMSGAPNGGSQGQESALPPLPPGMELSPGLTAPDAISKTLSSMQPPQLLDVLSQMKNLVHTNPQQATVLLQQAPQLSYAIFQALLLLGLVDTSVVGQLIQQQPQQAPPAAAPQLMQQNVASTNYGAPPMPMPPPGGYPPQFSAPPPQQQQYAPPPMHFQQGYAPTPPVQQQAYQPPPMPPQQQQMPALPSDPAQAALIQQVLGMSRDQIFQLDETPRNQILALRAQYGAPVA